MNIFLAVIGLSLLVIPLQGIAAQPHQEGIAVGMRGEQIARPGQDVTLPADSLEGSTIVDPQRYALGRIDSVVLDLVTGAISYIVLEPGTKDRLIPIPFGVFKVSTGKQLVLDIDQGRVYTAPSFPKGAKPNWSDRVFDQRVVAFWGRMPSGVGPGQAELRSSSSQSANRQ
jgi:hypothetical protein